MKNLVNLIFRILKRRKPRKLPARQGAFSRVHLSATGNFGSGAVRRRGAWHATACSPRLPRRAPVVLPVQRLAHRTCHRRG